MRAALSTCTIRSTRIALRSRHVRRGTVHQWSRYAATNVPTKPKTYFQDQDPLPSPQLPEPPRQGSRLIWRFVRGSIVAAAAFALGLTVHVEMHRIEDEESEDEEEYEERAFGGFNGLPMKMRPSDVASYCRFMLTVPESSKDVPFVMLPTTGNASLDTITHHCVLAANTRCEDHSSSAEIANQYNYWGIFDGHAGEFCSRLLANIAVVTLVSELLQAGIIDDSGIEVERPSHLKPNYRDEVIDALKRSFVSVDDALLGDAKLALTTKDHEELQNAIGAVYMSSAGSCGLVSLYDAHSSKLWVANAGDSRAVLGRWDASQQKYIAMPLSEDHTGFNEKEVARIQAEHPGENVVDPATGRVFGLAVTRAFGDARWKWPDQLNQLAHDRFGAHPPRPNQVIKTPPYITAEPEVRSIDIQSQTEKPDFLVMASDGLWDKMSSEEAIQCVNLWLSKSNDPAEALKPSTDNSPLNTDSFWSDSATEVAQHEVEESRSQTSKSASDHWVVEAKNCAAHLVQNALGGDRRGQVIHCMTVHPPFSRNLFDDMTVNVIFFGQDTSGLQNGTLMSSDGTV